MIILKEIWRKYNLTDEERDYVRAACSHHSSLKYHDFKYDETVSAILKDADALDRCRFHVNGRLDKSYLINKDVCVSLIPLTEVICTHTNNNLDKQIAFSAFIDSIV